MDTKAKAKLKGMEQKKKETEEKKGKKKVQSHATLCKYNLFPLICYLDISIDTLVIKSSHIVRCSVVIFSVFFISVVSLASTHAHTTL